jgi:hypothetical protein
MSGDGPTLPSDQERDAECAEPVETAPRELVRKRFRFGMKWLLGLPVLAALLLVVVDRWTAVPMPDFAQSGAPLIFKIIDGGTGQTHRGASVTMIDDGNRRMSLDATFGQIRVFGGHRRTGGYRSLVRDTRYTEVRDMRVQVSAKGFRLFEADAAEISRNAHPAPDGSRIEYIVRLRRL